MKKIKEQSGHNPDPSDPARSTSIDQVIQLMHQWMDDKSGYDTQTWPRLKQALDQDRPSKRRLFDG